MIGTGKPSIRSRKLNASEFFSARRKSLSLKIFWKFSMPTQALPA